MTERLTFENVDVHDRRAVIEWVEGVCNGLKVDEAAVAMDTDPTVSAVVGEITDFFRTALERKPRASVKKACLLSRRVRQLQTEWLLALWMTRGQAAPRRTPVW